MNARKDDAVHLSGAYAVNALDARERAQFEAHLAQSEDARNEATELADTAMLLGLAVPAVDPPSRLKASIMAQLDSTPQLPALTPVVADVAPVITRAEEKARARWFRSPVVALAAVAAAVALVVGGSVVTTTLVDNQFQQAQADQFAAITTASDSQRITSPVDGGGSATLIWSSDLASSALVVDGLASLPSDKVYELWYIDEAGARPAGTFSMGDSGRTWRVLDGDMGTGDIVGVTVEPTGGSKTPTTDPVIAIQSA